MRTLISGAGIAGLTLALRLSRAGHEVTIAELAGEPRDEGYMVDFFGPGFDARLERSSLYYDRVSQIRMDAWTSGRVAVCGDAAWCVSLMAGQGASLALAGADLLGAAVERAGADVAGALAGWERDLRPDVTAREESGRSTADWFVPTSRWRMAVRDLGIRTAAMPVLCRLARWQIGIGRPGT